MASRRDFNYLNSYGYRGPRYGIRPSERQRPVVFVEAAGPGRPRIQGTLRFKTRRVGEHMRCKYCDNPMHLNIMDCIEDEEYQERRGWEAEEFRVERRFLRDPERSLNLYKDLVTVYKFVRTRFVFITYVTLLFQARSVWIDIARGCYGLIRWKFEALLRIAHRVPEDEQVVLRCPPTIMSLSGEPDVDMDAMYYEYRPGLQDRHGVPIFRDQNPLCLDLDEMARDSPYTSRPAEGKFYLTEWEEDYLLRCAARE